MLQAINSNLRDGLISLNEKTHTYTVQNVSKVFSVTGLVHSYFPAFNADDVIRKMRKNPGFLTGIYGAMNNEQIKAKWNFDGKMSATLGTNLHQEIEDYYDRRVRLLEEYHKWVKKDVLHLLDNYETCEVGELQKIELKGMEWASQLYSVLLSSGSIEFKYFLDFDTSIRQRLIPYRTEWSIYTDPMHDRCLAGQLDILYRIKDTDTFALYDWKRSKEIKTRNYYEKGKDCLRHLENCNYVHYSLQLNLYKYILEHYYEFEGKPMKIVEMKLVVLHPDFDQYQLFDVNLMEKEASMIIKEFNSE